MMKKHRIKSRMACPLIYDQLLMPPAVKSTAMTVQFLGAMRPSRDFRRGPRGNDMIQCGLFGSHFNAVHAGPTPVRSAPASFQSVMW
jgi:hypothetical protein